MASSNKLNLGAYCKTKRELSFHALRANASKNKKGTIEVADWLSIRRFLTKLSNLRESSFIERNFFKLSIF